MGLHRRASIKTWPSHLVPLFALFQNALLSIIYQSSTHPSDTIPRFFPVDFMLDYIALTGMMCHMTFVTTIWCTTFSLDYTLLVTHFTDVSLGAYSAWYIIGINTHLPKESQVLRIASYSLAQVHSRPGGVCFNRLGYWMSQPSLYSRAGWIIT